MTSPTIETRIAGRVATVRLTRDAVRNAFNETMIAELHQAFQRLGADAGVRAIVLAARGPAFCAGADLSWMARMADFTPEQNRRDALALAEMLHAIHTCPKLTIARVHGDAYAGGIGLVAACDVAFAAAGAGFCLSEVRLGLIPATIAPYVLRAIGERAAHRYLLSAERFDAAEACRIGLVHAVTAPDALDARIDGVLSAAMQTSGEAVAQGKRLLRDLAGQPLSPGLIEDTADRIAAARASVDGREGVRAFLEKRKPRWLAEYDAEADPPGDDEEM